MVIALHFNSALEALWMFLDRSRALSLTYLKAGCKDKIDEWRMTA